MKRVVPSTRGNVTVTVRRRQGAIACPAGWSRFGGIRAEINILIAGHDTREKPVEASRPSRRGSGHGPASAGARPPRSRPCEEHEDHAEARQRDPRRLRHRGNGRVGTLQAIRRHLHAGDRDVEDRGAR